jgi:hypothetical protein
MLNKVIDLYVTNFFSNGSCKTAFNLFHLPSGVPQGWLAQIFPAFADLATEGSSTENAF